MEFKFESSIAEQDNPVTDIIPFGVLGRVCLTLLKSYLARKMRNHPLCIRLMLKDGSHERIVINGFIFPPKWVWLLDRILGGRVDNHLFETFVFVVFYTNGRREIHLRGFCIDPRPVSFDEYKKENFSSDYDADKFFAYHQPNKSNSRRIQELKIV